MATLYRVKVRMRDTEGLTNGIAQIDIPRIGDVEIVLERDSKGEVFVSETMVHANELLRGVIDSLMYDLAQLFNTTQAVRTGAEVVTQSLWHLKRLIEEGK